MANQKLTNLSFLMAVFLTLLNLKFQPKREFVSPFETQRVTMVMFVICILVYAITLCTPYFPELIDDINLLAGSFATVLLTFTLFPDLGWFILFIWVIFFVKLIYRAIRKFSPLYRQRSSTSHFFKRVLLGRHAHHNEERLYLISYITSSCMSILFLYLNLARKRLESYSFKGSIKWLTSVL